MPLTGGETTQHEATGTDLDAALNAALLEHTVLHGAPAIAVAASGGSDSTALLHLAARWGQRSGRLVHAVTVDHGLRPGSAEEAAWVAALCERLGLPHATLRWAWDGRGNLQQEARRARHRLIGAWAREQRIGLALLGHTRDDQAETVLLRLARGSGVDGLAGMGPEFDAAGVLWVRPLLGHGRELLRGWLRQQGQGWRDDPSNDDERFDRVRARRLLADGGLGWTVDRLVRTAAHMARARDALWAAARARASSAVREVDGDLILSRDLLWPEQDDAAARLMAAAIQWTGGVGPRPRWDALVAAAAGLRTGRAATLGGCLLRPGADGVRVTRELRAVAPPVAADGGASFAAWDGRWGVRVPPGTPAGWTVGALGEDGLAQAPAAPIPRETRLAGPAVRVDGRVIAEPLAGWGDATATRQPPWSDFLASRRPGFASTG